ncbi:Reverse transcriptase (RNA-dependent DNA polymerase) [Pseudobutyrivibrio sp. NOR37]|uniref:RNA-directed DNA polymerase n=2 Tax=Lachnospiraceae TaxID=186803 RepID=A0A6M0LCR5_PSEXY|nr:RNA-directed DNA polymerase [Pseudobutyrivibrio xylanivorans]SFR59865.1 Reverse transcriptase (RNA-dependent DNA polymerase) [Pseudobutyrivibrio sp. NOR37]
MKRYSFVKASIVKPFFMGDNNGMNGWNIQDKEDFYNRIGVKTDLELKSYVSFLAKNKYYKQSVEIPKKNGTRLIYNIDKTSELYRIHNNLKKQYLDRIYISDAAYGFVKKRSYYDYLVPHLNKYKNRHYMRIDISSFFDSIKSEHIENAFGFILKECKDRDYIIERLKEIFLYNGTLAQGTPIAPAVSNIVFRELDIRIEKYCNKRKVVYTRYADDLLFSSDDNTVMRKDFYRGIRKILGSRGFNINEDKTINMSDSIVMNGIVVGKSIHLSRKKLKPIRTMLFALKLVEKEKDIEKCLKCINNTFQKAKIDKTFNSAIDVRFYLCGYRSYLIQILKYCEDINIENRLKKIINSIESYLNGPKKSFL